MDREEPFWKPSIHWEVFASNLLFQGLEQQAATLNKSGVKQIENFLSWESKTFRLINEKQNINLVDMQKLRYRCIFIIGNFRATIRSEQLSFRH